MELLYESGLKPSLDLVELNPFLDERGKSALLLVDLTASLFGRQVYSGGARGKLGQAAIRGKDEMFGRVRFSACAAYRFA